MTIGCFAGQERTSFPNCAKNCVDAHRRWPTQLTQIPAFPTLTDANRRQKVAPKAGALPKRQGFLLLLMQHEAHPVRDLLLRGQLGSLRLRSEDAPVMGS